MSINFSGFKNPLAVAYHNNESILLRRVAVQPTEEDAKFFESLVDSKTGFADITLSTPGDKFENSYLSINDKTYKFAELKKENLPLIQTVGKLLNNFSKTPFIKLDINPEKAIKQIGTDINFDDTQLRNNYIFKYFNPLGAKENAVAMKKDLDTTMDYFWNA